MVWKVSAFMEHGRCRGASGHTCTMKHSHVHTHARTYTRALAHARAHKHTHTHTEEKRDKPVKELEIVLRAITHTNRG